MSGMVKTYSPVSILHKSIAGRYRPVRVADGPITARYRFIKNASWENQFNTSFGPIFLHWTTYENGLYADSKSYALTGLLDT